MIERIVVSINGLNWSLTPEEFERCKLDLRKVSYIVTHETVSLEELRSRLDAQNGYSWYIYDKTMPDRRTGFMPHRTEGEARALLTQLKAECFMDDYDVRREKD